MNKQDSFFPYFTRGQRRGIISLLFIIVLLQLLIVNFNHFFSKEEIAQNIPQHLQIQYDSLKKIVINKQKKKIYPFNPNYLSNEKAYFLGINLQEIKKIQNFRKKGKYFQNKKQFKQISGISDSLYNVLENYIKIPVFKKFNNYNNQKIIKEKININTATAQELMQIYGIGNVLSKRIIKFRNSIGGFSHKEQLSKVYGLEPEVIQKIWKRFYLKSSIENPKKIIKKPINSATANDLQKINGIGEILSNRIIANREKLQGYTIKEQLNFVYGLKPEVIDKIWKYYYLEKPNQNVLKINLNDSNIKELAKNPYISYQLAKKIVSYRTLHGGFYTFDELLKVKDFPKEKYKVITLFLTM